MWEAIFWTYRAVENFLLEMGDKIESYKITDIPEGYLVEWEGEEE